jgi:O-6-methylguanine DNA methyltransferase
MSGSVAIHTSSLELSLGTIHLACTPRGLCLSVLGSERAWAELAAWTARHEDGARIVETTEGLTEAIEQLRAYDGGALGAFELELDLRGTPFQLRVWEELRRIPCGVVRTYGQLAARLGKPGASRAVGGANGRNPIPLIVPCHRVIASNGIGGFTGGLEWKERLLAHEGVAADLLGREHEAARHR